METESGAKIAIRGKGSVKEGKGRSDAAHTSNQEEDLHCLIMADTEDKVNKAKQLIHNVIETVIFWHLYLAALKLIYPLQAASIPEGQNELKRNQLRELAALNGTLRDDENQACQNCGQIGHRKYDCPEQRNFTANIICRVCGNAGHMARDCPDRQRGQDWRNGDRPAGGAPGRPAGRLEPADTEFNNLMQELGAGGAITGGAAPARIEAGAGGYGEERGGAKPWQRGPTGGPAPWQQGGGGGGRERDSGSSGAPAPWAAGGSGGGRATDSYGGYGGQSSGAAPWQQAQPAAPQGGYGGGYGGYPGYGYGGAPGYDQGYGQAAAPGMAPWQQQGYGASGSPPPPPSGDAPPPPPPPSENPPPPPPPGA